MQSNLVLSLPPEWSLPQVYRLRTTLGEDPTNPSKDRAPRPPSVTKRKMQNINQEVSPHRAVVAVSLLRIERGRAFADLLNAKGKGSGKNVMGYVERTLGFRTRELDNRDIRLILRIGFFDILKLNIPSYAVVNEVGEARWGYLYLVLAQLILQKQGESPVFSSERSLLYNLHMDWSHQILSQKIASILESSKALHGRSICSPPGSATSLKQILIV
ncbi:uncharacterized protein LOC144558865 isoform X1 [Carex rostrata]